MHWEKKGGGLGLSISKIKVSLGFMKHLIENLTCLQMTPSEFLMRGLWLGSHGGAYLLSKSLCQVTSNELTLYISQAVDFCMSNLSISLMENESVSDTVILVSLFHS